ncbi:MAG: DNA replication/repair protein RecF [Candidatus Fimimonas sp.]
MKITQIQLANYRNLKTQTVTPTQGLNVFVGDNAQGKTNLVESVYLCCIGKSPRTDKDKDLIRWGEQKARVKVTYLCRYGEGEIEIDLTLGARKKITVNGVPVAKTGDLMGYLNCIYFSPNEIRIISQSPAERRRFLDVDLCQTDKNYFYSLVRYNKALAQRNNALKTARDLDGAKDAAFCWDKIIAEEGARIVLKRRRFCAKLAPLAKQAHEKLCDGKETLETEYVSGISGENLQQLTKNFSAALEENLIKDFQLRHTSVGCQRDDISLKINGVDVRSFGSQGQLRTTALSLKLAELSLFRETIGEYPVLILDDVLSELDADRQKRLLNFHEDLQILLTSATDVSQKLLAEKHKIFAISGGVCTEKI